MKEVDKEDRTVGSMIRIILREGLAARAKRTESPKEKTGRREK